MSKTSWEKEINEILKDWILGLSLSSSSIGYHSDKSIEWLNRSKKYHVAKILSLIKKVETDAVRGSLEEVREIFANKGLSFTSGQIAGVLDKLKSKQP